jgi:radical SAM superfamily enzyme YgiQ (UPF0313 family)
MKVVLINPDSPLRQSNEKFKRFVAPVPPLGISYIAAVLENNGIEVIVFDQVASNMSNEELIDKIRRESPQLVGISCLTPAMNTVNELVEQIRAFPQHIPVVLGNTHATIFCEDLLKRNLADIIVLGEGEESMLEVALAIQNKSSMEGIRGISFVRNGTIHHGAPREYLKDLDEFPYPAWHLFNLRDYERAPMLCLDDGLIVPIQASRGCFYQCIFCSQDKIFKKFRYRKVNRVVDEIDFFYRRYGITRFVFIDANFPFSKDYGLQFCDEFIKRGLHKKIKWLTETRVDYVDLELLKRMKEAGLYLIMYGFEVGNQKILDSIRKGTTLQQARQAMQDTRKAGIYTLGLFMLGMPGETVRTCEETIRFAKELGCDVAKFNIAIPLPGSRFFEEYKETVKNKDPEKFTSWDDWSSVSGNLLYMPEGMTEIDLKNLQRKAMFQFYVRPSLILRHLRNGTISFKNMWYGAHMLISGLFRMLFCPFMNRPTLRSLKNKDFKLENGG